jgi:hypothetical protein
VYQKRLDLLKKINSMFEDREYELGVDNVAYTLISGEHITMRDKFERPEYVNELKEVDEIMR